jgi:hypothetical protein
MRRVLLVAALLAGGPLAGAATLYDLYRPPGAPGPGPRNATSLWRVWVKDAGQASRCADDSDPTIYVRAAPIGSAHADDWVFHIPGGGSGTDADALLFRWSHGEHQELSSRWADQSRNPGGILSGDRANPFRDWNVVNIDKCTMDLFLGTRQAALTTANAVPLPGGSSVPAGTTYDIYFHGGRIVADAIELLRGGNVRYLDHTQRLVTLPDLDFARRILWTGSSGGGQGATLNADWVRSLLPATADVRLVADASFFPGAELLYDAQQQGWITGSIYDGLFGFDAQSQSRSDVHYDTARRQDMERWGAQVALDQSCLAAHSGQDWMCFDDAHVLMNHIGMRVFVRQDLNDRNHLSPCWQVEWRAGAADCYLPSAPPPAEAERYALATQWQFADLARLPADNDEGASASAPVGFGPRCGQHVGLTNDDGFFRHGVVDPATNQEVTFAVALQAWVRGAGVTRVEPTRSGPFPDVCQ